MLEVENYPRYDNSRYDHFQLDQAISWPRNSRVSPTIANSVASDQNTEPKVTGLKHPFKADSDQESCKQV